LDADCVVLRSIDDLFQREQFSAAPDAGWPDCFNSGVFVYRPSKETFNKLMLFASQQNSSFDGLNFIFTFSFIYFIICRW
jgi:glycogenin glucosyltransferase